MEGQLHRQVCSGRENFASKIGIQRVIYGIFLYSSSICKKIILKGKEALLETGSFLRISVCIKDRHTRSHIFIQFKHLH